MSERAPQIEQAPLAPNKEIAEHSVEAIQPGEVVKNGKNVEQARSEVKQEVGANQSRARAELAGTEQVRDPADSAQQISRELRQASWRQEISAIQRRLSAPQRALSRVVHQPTVRVVSEVAGRSVSRPSGLLGGGLVAFIGSSSYLYYAHHRGFRYNYFAFFILLLIGFAIGLALELAVHFATRSRHQHD